MPKSSGADSARLRQPGENLGSFRLAPAPQWAEDLLLATPNPTGSSLDWAMTWLRCRHLAVPTGRQLGSFRNLPPEGTVRRLGGGRPPLTEGSPAPGKLEKGCEAQALR